MSQRLRKSTLAPESKHESTQTPLPARLQESKHESKLSAVQDERPIADIPYLASGPTIALNARISPALMSQVKAFCARTKRKLGPGRITIQEFIACALERELARQLFATPSGLNSNGRESPAAF